MSRSLITDYIQESKEQELSMEKLYYKELDTTDTNDKLLLLSDSILQAYMGDLMSITYDMTLTEKEISKYHYRPHLLSYDLYGTTEFWELLLEVNNLSSFTEFNINPIKVFNGSLPEILGTILNIEKESIDLNAEEIKK